MTLDEALATARERGLKSLSLHMIGTGDKQYQISSKFAHSGGHHINIGDDLAVVLLKALNPPTGQNAPERGDPTPADTEVAEMIEADDPAGRAAYDARVASEQAEIGLFD